MNRSGLMLASVFLLTCLGCGGGGGGSAITVVRGKIVSSLVTQEPVGDAVVIVSGYRTQTDTDGNFSVQFDLGLPRGTGSRVWLTVSKDQFNTHDAEVDVTAGVTTTLQSILIAAAPGTGTLIGTVTSTSGQPVPVALVTAEQIRSRLRTTKQSEGIQQGHTDNDGGYEISGILPGNQQVTVVKENFLTESTRQEIIAGETATLNVSLTPGEARVTVTGVVRDLDDQSAIEGATVTLDAKSAVSQSGGAFSIENVLVGTQTVTATKSGYDSYSSSVTVTGGTSLTITMAKSVQNPPGFPFTIAGTISWTGGSDFSGVVVSAVASGGATADSYTTGSNGQYWLWVNPGTYTVTAEKAGFTTATRTVDLPVGATLTGMDLTLVPSG